MSDPTGRGVWRVRALDGVAREGAFDALVLVHDPSHQAWGERHVGLAVPHEGETADVPLTLVVNARPGVGPLVVEYEGYSADGARRVLGRSAKPLAAMVRTATGIAVTGIPAGPAAPPLPTA